MIHVKDHDEPLGEWKVDWEAVRAVLPTLPYNTRPGAGSGWYVLETPAGDDPIASAKRLSFGFLKVSASSRPPVPWIVPKELSRRRCIRRFGRCEPD